MALANRRTSGPHRVAVDPEDAPASPPARRLNRPRWLDLRMIIGVVLVLGSVLVGARVIGAADRSTTVWGLRSDLAAGTVLEPGDLRQMQVRLYADGDNYLSTTSSPVGKTLAHAVGAGELLPRSAVAEQSEYLTVSLAAPAARVPATLRRGQQVHIYASQPDSQAPSTTQVGTAVTVLQVSGRSTGALSVGSANLQVLLSVPQCAVTALLDATEGKTLSLVVLPSGVDAAPAAPCPPTSSAGPEPTGEAAPEGTPPNAPATPTAGPTS